MMILLLFNFASGNVRLRLFFVTKRRTKNKQKNKRKKTPYFRFSARLANVESRSTSKEQILSKDVVSLTKERDEAREQLGAANNNVQQYARAVANLQGVRRLSPKLYLLTP